MRRMKSVLSAAAFLIPTASFAGLEQAAGAAAQTFQATLAAPMTSLAPAFHRVRALDDEDSLIALLSDNDAAVRAQAARSLKNYAAQSWKTETALLQRAQDGNERESVRREAIKSLAWAAQHWNTRDALLRLAADSGETLTLRAITLKSLYAVANDDTVQRALFDALDANNPLILRAAAVWALPGSGAFDTRDKLLALAGDENENAALRLEAVKSLYAKMGDWSVRDAVLKLAQNDNDGTPLSIRQTAMLCLGADNQDWTVKDYLQREAQDEQNAALRTAAIKALSNGPDLETVRYFHLSSYLGRFIDPLEDQ